MATRRSLLKRAVAGGAAVFSGAAPGLAALAQPLPVRREINSLRLNDPIVNALRDGVRILKARRPGQGPSWADLGAIHGSSDGFNLCPHGNWYFLPWHRAYIATYERIIRAATGYMQFAMPYWDWSAHRAVPQAFREPSYNGQPNPLFEPRRDSSATLPDNITGAQVTNQIYGETNYEMFGTSRPRRQTNTDPGWLKQAGVQGVLEGTPHNLVHGRLGGLMNSAQSALDPIFQMHHGNIDRIWWRWNALGRQNTPDPLWHNMEFKNHFLRPNGARWSATPSAVQSVEAMGYSYGPVPPRMPAAPTRRVSDQRLTQVFAQGSTGAAGLGVRTLAAAPERTAQGAAFSAKAPSGDTALAVSGLSRPQTAVTPQTLLGSRAVALISGLTPATDAVQVRVFVDAPAGAPASGPDGPGYVTTIGFFGATGHAGHGDGISASADLTGAIQALGAAGVVVSDEIRVRLEAIDETGAPSPETTANARVEIVIV